MHIHDLPTPALLLDAAILEQNCSRMQDRANRLNVRLRPHIKTHKCIPIALRQAALGANGLTVSTWFEAEHFASAGFPDLTWALPFPLIYAERAAILARNITLRLVVDSIEAVDALEAQAAKSGVRFHVWLKTDCGLHRAGVDPAGDQAIHLARRIANSRHMMFDGILTHAGHSYNAASVEEIRQIAAEERRIMCAFADRLRSDGVDVAGVSIGSTPTITFAQNLEGVTEVRPGNYVFHDLTMVSLGVCAVADCAVSVLASVISTGPGTLLTDAGALALSKDSGPTHQVHDTGLGLLYRDYTAKELYHPGEARVISVSQEHGKVAVGNAAAHRVGDRIRILEQHSCLTAALFDRYYVVEGDRVVDRWEILRGRV